MDSACAAVRGGNGSITKGTYLTRPLGKATVTGCAVPNSTGSSVKLEPVTSTCSSYSNDVASTYLSENNSQIALLWFARVIVSWSLRPPIAHVSIRVMLLSRSGRSGANLTDT